MGGSYNHFSVFIFKFFISCSAILNDMIYNPEHRVFILNDISKDNDLMELFRSKYPYMNILTLNGEGFSCLTLRRSQDLWSPQVRHPRLQLVSQFQRGTPCTSLGVPTPGKSDLRSMINVSLHRGHQAEWGLLDVLPQSSSDPST